MLRRSLRLGRLFSRDAGKGVRSRMQQMIWKGASRVMRAERPSGVEGLRVEGKEVMLRLGMWEKCLGAMFG